jgi:hypothetical protein
MFPKADIISEKFENEVSLEVFNRQKWGKKK